MKQIARDLPHYLTLFGILFAGFIGFTLFSYDKGFQIAVAVAAASAYVIWGIVHHFLHKDLYLEIVFEYIAVAVLGLTILFSLVIRG